MVVPDRSSSVRRFRVSRKALYFGLGSIGLVFLFLIGGIVHYGMFVGKVQENRDLRGENLELRNQLVDLHQKVSSIQAVLDRVERFDAKLRAITQLHDPKRHLAMGAYSATNPSDQFAEGLEGVDPLVRAIADNPHMAISLIGQNLEELASEAEKREGSIRQLETYLRGQKVRLASTPSIWPAHGWVTSGFGIRVDPYTGKRAMHRGLDVANQIGVPVIASARGVVTFRGVDGGFGKVLVVDHGYGIRTRYGHLDEFKVQLGEHVERGSEIGTIGNSGRSTGPHLHYEVEVNGICENPKNFILEE